MTFWTWVALFVLIGFLSDCGKVGMVLAALLLALIALYIAAPLLHVIAQAVRG